ncbi:MAG: VTC domain-containing protein [Myxococcota bacterium]
MQSVTTTSQQFQTAPSEAAALRGYLRADAELIASRALLQRADSKFILTRRELCTVLSILSRSFALLAPPTTLWGNYVSIYFDTPDLMLFHDQRRGRRRRFKVRLRHYHDRGLTFLEVKRKDRPGRTDKLRRQLAYGRGALSSDDMGFLDEAIAPAKVDLAPIIATEFRRITLVGRDTVERVTFDLDLKVSRHDIGHSFGDAVIAEVKQPRLWNGSPTMSALRACGARAGRPSKYCMGIMALDEAVRANRLRPRLRALEEVAHG